jgi:hypothetical protein
VGETGECLDSDLLLRQRGMDTTILSLFQQLVKPNTHLENFEHQAHRTPRKETIYLDDIYSLRSSV